MEKDIKPVWGAKAIAKAIDRPLRATFALLEKGAIPAKKVGRRWVSNQDALRKVFSELNGVGE
jgi:hypothetical protein